jgi:hypothetical protein
VSAVEGVIELIQKLCVLCVAGLVRVEHDPNDVWRRRLVTEWVQGDWGWDIEVHSEEFRVTDNSASSASGHQAFNLIGVQPHRARLERPSARASGIRAGPGTVDFEKRGAVPGCTKPSTSTKVDRAWLCGCSGASASEYAGSGSHRDPRTRHPMVAHLSAQNTTNEFALDGPTTPRRPRFHRSSSASPRPWSSIE